MGLVSVSLGDASDPTRREGEGQMGRRKETPGGPFDGNGWVLGRGEVQNDKGGKGKA